MAETISARVPARLKRAVLRASEQRGYTLTGFVVRALEDALTGGFDTAKRFVGRGEINLYAPREFRRNKQHRKDRG